jgi:hypothetical protein
MKAKMTHALRMELADVVRDRYAAAANKDKRKILEELIAATGYHEKSAIRVLNRPPEPKGRQTRQRASLYDEAERAALIVLWEASDRVCGKRLKAPLPILLPALERNGHLKLETEIRAKILSMSAATIDRLLQAPKRAGREQKRPRIVPEPRRRIKMRTFADWNEPPPGSMEMDLVAHCGEANRSSYVHSLVVTDIASGWTEAAPIVVREGTLVVEALERIRLGLPFALRALDVDNVLCREAALVFGQQISSRRRMADADSKLIQMVSTVNGIAPSHSKHRIQRRPCGGGPHRPQDEIRTQVEGPNIIYRVACRALTALAERGPSTWHPTAPGTVGILSPS